MVAIIGHVGLKIARSSLLAPISRRILVVMSTHLPVNYLRKTQNWVAFLHPSPSHRVHVLIMPKHPIASLAYLSDTPETFYIELFDCVRSLVNELELEKSGYRLVMNGGRYQDVPQLHFHLISE
jgi:diadenosine tetraphosphate (Ap4A) HIT family hydrolase